MADSVEMVLDKDDIIKLPIIGEEVLNNVNVMKQARANGNETFLAPVVVPKLPSRNYFLFHKPYNTQDLNMYDKARCREVYTQIKNDVSQGITELIDIREKDPYGQDFLKRVTYELVNGKQAPWVSE